MLPWTGLGVVREWRWAMPFAGAWMAGMFCLFGAFASIGVLYGGILQSTRGLITMGLGALIARAGMHHLEAHVARGVFLRRLLAATLMTGAVSLYILTAPADTPKKSNSTPRDQKPAQTGTQSPPSPGDDQ